MEVKLDLLKKIKNAYDPFKECVTMVDCVDSLYAIWAYYSFLLQKKEVPDIEYIREIELNKSNEYNFRYVSPWELELLAREILVSSIESKHFDIPSFRSAKYFVNALNNLKSIGGVFEIEKVRRLTYVQFPWQGENHVIDGVNILVRYYNLFNHVTFEKKIREEYGLSLKKLFFVGFTLLSHFQNNFELRLPYKNKDIPDLKDQEIDAFLNKFSLALPEIRKRVEKEQAVDENFLCRSICLKALPLIKLERSIVCPIPDFLLWSFTKNLYYTIYDQNKDSKIIGENFEKYIKKVIKAEIDIVDLFPKKKYGIEQKETSDYIIKYSKSLLFIEAKLKRIPFEAKTCLLDETAFNEELVKFSESIVQTYKVINDFINNEFSFSNKKQIVRYEDDFLIYPIIVTLEDSYIWGSDSKLLEAEVCKRLEENQIQLNFVSRFPYLLCSAREFEKFIQLIKNIDPDSFFKVRNRNEDTKRSTVNNLMYNFFNKDMEKNKKVLLKEEFVKIFPKGLII
ncbi:hypothetical protein KKH43_04810 [Patescibacteria group bacterium]|nr:hypothetical protein [Patescibacteria group bacterium]